MENLSTIDEIEIEPFDGVFEVEGMEQPLVVPTNITLGELTEIVCNTEIKRNCRLIVFTKIGIKINIADS